MSGRKQNQARYFRTFLAVGAGFLGFALSARAVYANGDPNDDLEILPEQGADFFGYPGGPFTPPQASYQLTNTSQDPLAWTAEPNVPWVDISPSAERCHPAKPLRSSSSPAKPIAICRSIAIMARSSLPT